ncbi:SRPBCC family protein [Marinobacter sp. F3R11]|uniref:SRPBCC family protein n=1 Tax=Marinobacter sp. F3R11 TaxID=2267231 RepID=UPI000DEB16F8|nr:SRPBCC family protein [Marinobacter sp. F3R11]RBW50673.1 SRPBCC family protein [Marinobacter sp. F3R11]
MATHSFEINETFDLPRSQVFALFADHQSFGKLLGTPVKRIKESNQADPNGLGSVRKLGIGPIGLEETITSFEPDSLIEYTITSFSLIRNHLGRIRFEETPEGHTRVRYRISFDDIVPFTGKLVRVALEQAIRRGVRQIPKMT